MVKLVASAEIRSWIGLAVRCRVEQHYESQTVWAFQEQEFRRLLDQ